MYLASLNVDVLLYLIDFIDPVDRFYLALSGILLGLENVNKGMDLKRRYFQHISHYRLCKFCNMQYIISSIYPDMNFGNWMVWFHFFLSYCYKDLETAGSKWGFKQ